MRGKLASAVRESLMTAQSWHDVRTRLISSFNSFAPSRTTVEEMYAVVQLRIR